MRGLNAMKVVVFVLSGGVVLCLAAWTGLPEWYRAMAGYGVWQQVAAFMQSAWLALVVLTWLWLERLFWYWRLYRQPERLGAYQALARWRRELLRCLEVLLAALAPAVAMVLVFEIGIITAVAVSLLVFGTAMGWLVSFILRCSAQQVGLFDQR